MNEISQGILEDEELQAGLVNSSFFRILTPTHYMPYKDKYGVQKTKLTADVLKDQRYELQSLIGATDKDFFVTFVALINPEINDIDCVDSSIHSLGGLGKRTFERTSVEDEARLRCAKRNDLILCTEMHKEYFSGRGNNRQKRMLDYLETGEMEFPISSNPSERIKIVRQMEEDAGQNIKKVGP
jgi:hypothetical protein